VSTITDVDKALGWIDKVIRFLRGFNPEITSLNVNLKTCESEMDLVLEMPDNLKRKIGKIAIPAHGNFTIDYVQDGSFRRIPQLWTFVKGKWVARASQLPPGKFLVRMRGSLPPEARTELVRIQPALNRDRTEAEERYWLDSMIRSPETLEIIYKSVNVEEVAVGVRVSLQRSFAAVIPKEVARKIEATQRWVQVGKALDRQTLFREWMQYRTAQKSTEVSVDEIMAAIYHLTRAEIFRKHVRVDAPYRIGEIQRKDPKTGPIPDDMEVEALTRLTLRSPIAQGHLAFGFRAFESELHELFGSEPGEPHGGQANGTIEQPKDPNPNGLRARKNGE